MKKFNELGVSIIKDLEHRASSEKLTELLYKANDILFALQMKYAINVIAVDALNSLKAIEVEINDVHVNDKYQLKKREILKCIRERCRILQQYMDNYTVEEQEERNAINVTIRYQLSISIKTKDAYNAGDKDIDAIIKQLIENKALYGLLSSKITAYNTDIRQFEKVQDELIALIVEEYSISKEA